MAANNNNSNGWNEWSKHVLKELERLNSNYESINTKIDSIKSDVHQELADIRNDITKVKAMQYSLDEMKSWKKQYEEEAVLKTMKELKTWKNEIDEVASPTQFSLQAKEIDKLKTFKTQAVTVFLVVQGLVGLALALLKYFG